MSIPATTGAFISHLGLGDMIVLIPAIVYCALQYTNLYVLCKEAYIDTIVPFLSQYTNITIICIPDYKNENEEYNILNDAIHQLINEHPTIELIRSGNFHKSLQSIVDFPINFYKDMNIDYTTAISRYTFPITPKALELYTIIKNTGKQHIFMHTQASNYSFDLDIHTDTTDVLFINPEKNVYALDHPFYTIANKFLRTTNNLTVLDYKLIIENASELHLIDSCYFCFAAQLESNASIRVVYSRYNGYFTTLTKNKWQHLFIDTTSNE